MKYSKVIFHNRLMEDENKNLTICVKCVLLLLNFTKIKKLIPTEIFLSGYHDGGRTPFILFLVYMMLLIY